jgi:hypothetical protein
MPLSTPKPNDADERPSSEELLDAAVEHTFPASDPIAVASAYAAARRREERSQSTPTEI